MEIARDRNLNFLVAFLLFWGTIRDCMVSAGKVWATWHMCIPRKKNRGPFGKLTYPEHVDQAHRERRPFLEDPTAVSTQGTSRQIKQIFRGELFARWMFFFWERVSIQEEPC